MQESFFYLENRYDQLNKLKDPLVELNHVIDWNLFADLLAETTKNPRKSSAGRKPFDRVMLFKVLILQRMNNLSDDRLEYQVRDRLSFMRFLGLDLAGIVPDTKTMWAFREELKSDQIIDAAFLAVPKQRNTREENKLIKEDVPIKWGQNHHKLVQKNTEARRTKKNYESFYGYKDHANVDQDTKLITERDVTSAEVHDRQILEEILQSSEMGGVDALANSVFRSNEQEGHLIASGHTSHIHEKGTRNHPFTEVQKSSNKENHGCVRESNMCLA